MKSAIMSLKRMVLETVLLVDGLPNALSRVPFVPVILIFIKLFPLIRRKLNGNQINTHRTLGVYPVYLSGFKSRSTKTF